MAISIRVFIQNTETNYSQTFAMFVLKIVIENRVQTKTTTVAINGLYAAKRTTDKITIDKQQICIIDIVLVERLFIGVFNLPQIK